MEWLGLSSVPAFGGGYVSETRNAKGVGYSFGLANMSRQNLFCCKYAIAKTTLVAARGYPTSTIGGGQIVRSLEPGEVAKSAALLGEKPLTVEVNGLDDYSSASQSNRIKTLYRAVFDQNPSGTGALPVSSF